jgi:hypothetical protein
MGEAGFIRPAHRDLLIAEPELDRLLARMAAHVPTTPVIHMVAGDL